MLTNKGDAAIGIHMTIGGQTVSFLSSYNPKFLRTGLSGGPIKFRWQKLIVRNYCICKNNKHGKSSLGHQYKNKIPPYTSRLKIYTVKRILYNILVYMMSISC